MAETNVAGTIGNSTAASGSLFQGKQFWLSQNVPQRKHFRDVIQENGGVIRLFEKDADIKLVDHVRKNLPADTYSYRFVEDSIRKGRLENLENYRAGPSASRPVGATNIPARVMKTPYTIQDDQFLWDWMQSYEKAPGASISGNRLYQEMALVNPVHSWQSYRDRYLRRLRGRPRPGGMPQPTALSAQTDQKAQTPGQPPRAAAAEIPDSSSKQRSSQGPTTADRLFKPGKRKRSPSPSSSDDPDSSGGDIPPRKRMTTRSPESNQRTPTPEVSQQGAPPQNIVNSKHGRDTSKILDTDKGKAPQNLPQAASQIAPQRPPQTPRQQAPRISPEKAAEKPHPDAPQLRKSPRNSPQRSHTAHRRTPQNAPQESSQSVLQKPPNKTPQKAPEKPPKPTPKQQQRPPSPVNVNGDYEPELIDPLFLELPFLPPSPGASELEEHPEQDIDAWIDSRLRKGLAKNEDQIIEALRCTSMDPHLADRVLKHLVAGKGIPTDIAGVWTAEDDRCIEGRDTREIERVLDKHGSDYFSSRWQYLDMARTAGLEEFQEEGITEL